MIIAIDSPSMKLPNKPANAQPTVHIKPVRIPEQTLVQ